MGDYIVRAMAANQQIRAFAITSKEMVEFARAAHNTSPVATAALGRLMSAGAMMGVMMKGEKDILTLQMKGTGPLRGVTVTADSKGTVKGYVDNPNADVPPKAKGKLDVGGAIGVGVLNVIKDMGLKEPYNGTCELKTGEIGDDLTYYFAVSEQVPSAVGLGVLVDTDRTVRQAGGFIIQLMPFIEEAVVDKLEAKLANVKSVTSMLDNGYTPEMILEELLGEFGLEFTDKMPTKFECNCDKARIEKALISVGRKSLNEMVQDGETIEVNCHFCNSKYEFTVEELKELIRRSK
jgi:molecular chaperone Hsp33